MLAHSPDSGVFDTLHDPGFLVVLDQHPENADRVRNMVAILRGGPIAPYIRWRPGRAAQIEELYLFHSPEYVEELVRADAAGGAVICPGTQLKPGSWQAALLAAGTAMEAMRSVLAGECRLAYALVRPPGHHAQPTQADGYCFLNNAGLAVHVALQKGCRRVCVVDVDVHYGNGTAEGFFHRDDVLTVSLHMLHGSWGESHPQSGEVREVGVGEGAGYNLNVPLPFGSGNRGYEAAMRELVVPAISRFRPEMLVMTLGQDSSAFDPNGRQCLTMDGYRRLGQIMREQAELHSSGRLLLVQEGGYHVTYAAYCLHATLEGVLKLELPQLPDPLDCFPEDERFVLERISGMKEEFQMQVAAELSRCVACKAAP